MPAASDPAAAGAAADSGGAGATVAGTSGATGTSSSAVSAGMGSQMEVTANRSCKGGECWWSSDASPVCSTAGVPHADDRPDPTQDGDETVPDIYLGWSRIWIGETDLDGVASDTAWQSFGFDLDGICTNSGTCSEVQNQQSCLPSTEQIPFDGALCRDNTFASLQPVAAAVPEIGKRFGISEAEFNCNLWRGSYTVVARLSGYNGKANDSDVRVDVYISPGATRPEPWECPTDSFSELYPLWRLPSAFKIDPANLDGTISESGTLPPSRVADAHAYVREGYLVASLPDGALVRLAADGTRYRGFAMTVYKGLWTGRLERAQDGRWYMRDGLAAGRVKAPDLIMSFRQIGLCHGVGLDGFYDSVVEYIDQNADVLSDGGNDPERACDAMSFGIGFEAAQLTPGPTADATPIVECCEPGVAIEDCDPKCGDGRKNGDEKCDSAIAAGQPGSCPTKCESDDSCVTLELVGEGCDIECKPKPVTTVGDADGCCPMGGDSTSDPDCAAVCGNGVLESGETCDPVGSCPACTFEDMCLVGSASGSRESCDIRCDVTGKSACASGDGCCPAGCTATTDSDCSTSCNNGTVDANETCDGSGAQACPSSCDDGEACTVDYMTGSAANCNVTCTHVAITEAQAGDGCCPAGASANSDSDCQVECGNAKVETGEDCDDGNLEPGDGCSPQCKRESPVEQCLAQLGDDRLPECARCNCEKCQDEVLGCYASPNADENTRCTTLVQCGLEKKCASETCYCGSVALTTCILGVADGACRTEVEQAAGTTIPGELVTRSNDTTYPLGRANALAACARDSCATECAIQN